MRQYNKDKLIGSNLPRLPYAISGTDWALEKGLDAPMIINLNSPGIYADDWINTYGTSLDSFLSIIDGFNLLSSVEGVTVAGVYKDGFPNTKTENIWAKVEPSTAQFPVQQIQYVVSGGDIETGRERVDDFGNLFNARGLCVRGPMMMCGYGRTKEMLPLNPDAGNPRLNTEDSKLDRTLWKVGTVDLRWDERRNVWGAWNDLIADKESKGLGTTVFSTNPDTDEGFPRLKGKLEDVWWVRQDETLDGTDGKVEGTQTAEVMTHLEHKWFDKDEEGSAKLSSIFIIPHNSLDPEGTADVCHEKGATNSVGDENTGTGASIDLKHEVHFHKSKDLDGPIRFTDSLSNLGDAVCCENSSAKLFIGEMVFLDEQPERCDGAPSEAGPPPCEWVPAVRIDECALVGKHFEVLVQNDTELARQMSNVCVGVNSYSLQLQDSITAGFNDLAGIAGAACEAAADVGSQASAGLADLSSQVLTAFFNLTESIDDGFQELVDAINVVLVECCEAEIDAQIRVEGPSHGFSGAAIIPKPCGGGSFSPIPEFECSNCQLVEIQAPCANNEGPFPVGFTCDSSSSKSPDYEDVGDCQAN